MDIGHISFWTIFVVLFWRFFLDWALLFRDFFSIAFRHVFWNLFLVILKVIHFMAIKNLFRNDGLRLKIEILNFKTLVIIFSKCTFRFLFIGEIFRAKFYFLIISIFPPSSFWNPTDRSSFAKSYQLYQFGRNSRPKRLDPFRKISQTSIFLVSIDIIRDSSYLSPLS